MVWRERLHTRTRSGDGGLRLAGWLAAAAAAAGGRQGSRASSAVLATARALQLVGILNGPDHRRVEVDLPVPLCLLVELCHDVAQPGRRLGDPAASLSQRFDLSLRRARVARRDRSRVAHPAAGRRRGAGDEVDDGLEVRRVRLLNERRRLLLRVASDLADHDDALRLRVGVKVLERVEEVCTVERVAADADDHRLAEPLGEVDLVVERRRLVHRLVRQRARARDDPDLSLLVDVAGHDADLARASGGVLRVDDARAVWPDQPRLRLAHQRFFYLDHVMLRHALRDADYQRDLGRDGLHDGALRTGRRHEEDCGIAVGLLLGLCHRSVEWQLKALRVHVCLRAALLGVRAADIIGAVVEPPLDVEGARLTRDARTDDLCVGVDGRRRRLAGGIRLFNDVLVLGLGAEPSPRQLRSANGARRGSC
mmetsp:Transcript_23747/g.70229  ORF Transcript_23747/g.70229 Transcript_23747/m.70229 type:complete len:424 (+) Transcript_23747:418-1689(+)